MRPVTIPPASAQTHREIAPNACPLESGEGISITSFTSSTMPNIVSVATPSPMYIARITAGCSPAAGSEMRTSGIATSEPTIPAVPIASG